MKSKNDFNRRVEYLKYCSDKIIELECENSHEVPFNKEEIDSFYQELNPETIYLEKEEYVFLNYLLDNKLTNMESKIIKYTFGFYGKFYSISETALKLKISTRMAGIIRNEATRKLKLLLKADEVLIKKNLR